MGTPGRVRRLRAVVIGAGWTGEGHTHALRYAGVDVVALCARVPEIVRAVAARLEVPEASTDWREVEGDREFSALLTIDAPGGEIPVTLVSGRGPHAPGEDNRTRIYGETGLLVVDGAWTDHKLTLVRVGAAPEALPVPDRLRATHPQLESDLFSKWATLAREFVADVRGEPHEPYLTFHDGWRYQVAIDAIRAGTGWHQLPTLDPTSPSVPLATSP